MIVSIAIQAHPSRQSLSDALRASLPGAEVVFDPDPSSPVRSPWRTYREALERTPADATHRLIVQDDALPCRNLVPTLDLIAAACPEVPVTLFVAGSPKPCAQRLFEACSAGDRYATIPTRPWVPAIALLWPVRLIEPVLAYVDSKRWPEKFNADDEIIGRAFTDLGERLLATVPSLVEHPDVVPSLVGVRRNAAGEDLTRVAACFLDEWLDPLDYDWS